MSTPLPALDPDNTAFWTGGEHGTLMINRCRACGRWSHPPVPICRYCHSRDIGPQQASGTATILTYTINRQQWMPEPPVPYVIAVVELDDDKDLRLTTRLVDVDPETVHIGMRVRVLFENVEDIWLPLFTPITEAAP